MNRAYLACSSGASPPTLPTFSEPPWPRLRPRAARWTRTARCRSCRRATDCIRWCGDCRSRDDNRTAFSVSGTRLEWLRSVFRGEPAAFEPSLFAAMLARYDAVSEAGAGAQAAVPRRRIPRIPPKPGRARPRCARRWSRAFVASSTTNSWRRGASISAPRSPTPTRRLAASARLRRTPTRCAAAPAHAAAAQPSVWAARDARDVASPRAHAGSRRRRRLRARGRAVAAGARACTPPHLAALEASPHLVGEPLRLGAGEHAYVDGRAHRMTRRKTIRAARHESVVLLLSSHPAARGAAGAVLGAVRDAFRSAVDSG